MIPLNARFALQGARRAGKTTTLERLVRGLQEDGLSVVGVIQPAEVQDGRNVGYSLLDVASGERRPFGRRRPKANGELGFQLDQDGFPWTAERLLRPGQVLVVDELGLLEAAGEGHLPAVRRALRESPCRAAVLAVRDEALPQVERLLGELIHWPLPAPEARERILRNWIDQLKEVLK